MSVDKEEALNEDKQKLVERLKSLVLTGDLPRRSVAPPVSEANMVQAEVSIGFCFPSLLKRLYLEVGNGGFGPAGGLYPLNNEEDPRALRSDSLVTTYLALRSMTLEEFALYWKNSEEQNELEFSIWPEKILQICDWGCNIYSYLDCSQPGYPVLQVDHNTAVRKLTVEASSFRQWLETWLNHAYF